MCRDRNGGDCVKKETPFIFTQRSFLV